MSVRKTSPGRRPQGRRQDVMEDRSLGRQLLRGMRLAVWHARGEVALPARAVEVPALIDVKTIRERNGLSQAEFARRFGFSARSLQEWEQGRRQPEGAAQAYLIVIDRAPAAVETALHGRV